MAKKKIYVAEDNPLQVVLLKAALKSGEDQEILFFGDGLEIYQKVQQEKPDLLILDIILPSLSGLAVSRLVKFNDLYRDIPVLVTSSITDANIREKALAAGADMFLPKPFQITEFAETVKMLLCSGECLAAPPEPS
ncbi:MAG: response regulator [Candidatus Eremiobacteraeota bacterium]|nr:response regulator [Candidatus Eremiobacteraeota bacterium]